MKRTSRQELGLWLAVGLMLLSCFMVLGIWQVRKTEHFRDQMMTFSREIPPLISRSKGLLVHHLEQTAQTMVFSPSGCDDLLHALSAIYSEVLAVHLYDSQLAHSCSAFKSPAEKGPGPIDAGQLIRHLGSLSLEGFGPDFNQPDYRVIVPCFSGQNRRGALEVVFEPDVLLTGLGRFYDGVWNWGPGQPPLADSDGQDRAHSVRVSAGNTLFTGLPCLLTFVDHPPASSTVFKLKEEFYAAFSLIFLLGALVVLWKSGLLRRGIGAGANDSPTRRLGGNSPAVWSEPPAEETDLRVLSQAVEQSNVAVMVTDTSGIIKYVNQKFLQLIGYDRDEVLGQTPRLFKSMSTPMEVYQDLWQTLAEGGSWRGEFYNRKKSGELFWDATFIAPVRDDGGRVVHYVAVKEDITERKQMEVELIATKEAAEAANRAKSHFLANMSHEIRTPMNAIIGMTELTLKTEIGEEQREYLKSVLSAAEKLLSILDDVLDLSKIESGVLRLDPTPFSLRDQLSFWMKGAAEDARQKGLEFLFDVDEQVPDALIGDFIRLEQIVTNLLENAVKFTSSGGILLRLEPAGSVEGHSIELHFMVSDTGLGIAEDKQKEIFEKFSQADVTATRRYGGTGLGLTLCSELVGMMRGRIWVESPSEWAYGGGHGPGSTFHFTVWIGRLDGEEGRSSPISAESIPFGQVILLFKNQMRVRMLKKWLEEMGVSVRVAMNFLEAWNWLMEDGPALLQTDTASWPQAAELVQVRLEPDRLPEGSRIHLYDETATGVVPDFLSPYAVILSRKPISKAALLAQLAGTTEQTVHPFYKQSPSPLALDPVGSRVPTILVVEDNSLNQKLVMRLLEKKGYQVEIAENGIKAVEAVRRRPFDLILMDIQMPELDGVSATRILRQEGFSMPIIALTAHAMKGDRETYIGAGMDDYLGKPVRQDELYNLLNKYLEKES